MVDEGLRAVLTSVYFVSPHSGFQVTPQSALPSGQLWQGILSVSSPSGSAPSPPTSHHSSEIDLGGGVGWGGEIPWWSSG